MLTYAAARDTLVKELRANAVDHEAEHYDAIGRRFDRLEHEFPTGTHPSSGVFTSRSRSGTAGSTRETTAGRAGRSARRTGRPWRAAWRTISRRITTSRTVSYCRDSTSWQIRGSTSACKPWRRG